MKETQRLAVASERSLAAILDAIGAEFTELAGFAEELQSVLSTALLRVAHDPHCHRNIQSLDLFSQRLRALSDFLAALGPAVPPAWRIDADAALHAVPLADLARHLQGHEPLAPQEPAGELELF